MDAQRSDTSFLNLPAELRVAIYTLNATSDLTASEYKGLYLSYRQVKVEMDDECITKVACTISTTFKESATKVGQTVAETSKTVISGLTLYSSKTFAMAHHVRVYLLIVYVPPKGFSEVEIIRSLAELPLESINITTYSGALRYEEDEGLDYFWDISDRIRESLSDTHLVGKIVYVDMNQDPSTLEKPAVSKTVSFYMPSNAKGNTAWGEVIERYGFLCGRVTQARVGKIEQWKEEHGKWEVAGGEDE
jgi:hypothetical protein